MRSRWNAPTPMPTFSNRKEGGRLLAGRLAARGYVHPVVLALSRGAMPVGYEIARALGASLELLSVKTGEDGRSAPRWSPELARRVLESELDMRSAPTGARAENPQHDGGGSGAVTCLQRGDGARIEILDRSVILVDDWIVCGKAVLSVLPDLRRGHPRRIVLATPVAALDACPELERELDELFWLSRPARGVAPEGAYASLEEITDATVIALLDRAALRSPGA